MAKKRSPYSGPPLLPKKARCGKEAAIEMKNGFMLNVICTRFADHKTQAKDSPLRHFDQVRRWGWYDDDEEPCAASPE